MKPEQVRMARCALRISVRELAEKAGVSFMTINRFETEKGGMQHSNAEAVKAALEALGIQFIDEGDTASGPGIVLTKGVEKKDG